MRTPFRAERTEGGSRRRSAGARERARLLEASRTLFAEKGLTHVSIQDITDGTTPHVVTLLDGSAELVTAHGAVRLAPYDTVVLPAVLGAYRLDASGTARAVVASVP